MCGRSIVTVPVTSNIDKNVSASVDDVSAQSTTCPLSKACKRGTKFSLTELGPFTEPEIMRP